MGDARSFWSQRYIQSPQSVEAALSLIASGTQSLEELSMTPDQQERFFALITKQSNRWARENEG